MRAYRSPAETRLSGVFAAATTRMQSAGQAAAQREQPTHFSSPESSKRCSLWRPRKRGYTGVFSSGYSYVTGPSAQRASVVLRPRSVSPKARYVLRTGPRSGARTTSTTSGPGSYGISESPSVDRHHEDRGHEGVERRQREEHLPAQRHQLVVAQPRQRGAHPDEHEDEGERLDEHDDRVDPRRRVDERDVPAAEEQRRAQRRDDDDVDVL